MLAVLAGGAAETGSQIVARVAQAQASRGAAALVQFMSKGEARAFQRSAEDGARFLGQAVHRATARALKKEFPGRFEYYTRGPDFLDRLTGEMIELTTPGQVGRHMLRPGYGGASFVTYLLGAH